MPSNPNSRETFATQFGVVATMIGVAVGLGNVWRFPYMMWEFGGVEKLSKDTEVDYILDDGSAENAGGYDQAVNLGTALI